MRLEAVGLSGPGIGARLLVEGGAHPVVRAARFEGREEVPVVDELFHGDLPISRLRPLRRRS